MTGDWRPRSCKTCWCSYPNKPSLIRKSGILYFPGSQFPPVPGEHFSSVHVWQEMKSQSGTGARTHLIERKPRCEFLSRLYFNTIFSGIILWFEHLKNINITDWYQRLVWLNPNWKRGKDQIKKDWKYSNYGAGARISKFYSMVTLDYFVKLGDDSWWWLDPMSVHPLPPLFLNYETKISGPGVMSNIYSIQLSKLPT